MAAPSAVWFCPMCGIEWNGDNHGRECPDCGREGE